MSIIFLIMIMKFRPNMWTCRMHYAMGFHINIMKNMNVPYFLTLARPYQCYISCWVKHVFVFVYFSVINTHNCFPTLLQLTSYHDSGICLVATTMISMLCECKDNHSVILNHPGALNSMLIRINTTTDEQVSLPIFCIHFTCH